MNLSSNSTYTGNKFTQLTLVTDLQDVEFMDCVFDHCDFSARIFTRCTFTNCKFRHCNLSLWKLIDCALHEVEFDNSRLTGVDFSKLSGLLNEFDCEACDLELAAFVKVKLSSRTFHNCQMKDAYFVDAELRKCDFHGSDLTGVRFENCDLREANFVAALNYAIDPAKNKIRKAKFSLPEAVSLLAPLDIVIVDPPAADDLQ